MNNYLQNQVSEFVERHDLVTDVEYRLLDLVSELGEVSKELLKATDYGRSDLRVDDLADSWSEELGDLFFSLICVANATKVDLEQSLSRVLEKYARRLAARQDAGSIH